MSLNSNLGSSDCLELKQNVAPLLGHLVADGVGRGWGVGRGGSTQEGAQGLGWQLSPGTVGLPDPTQ